MKLSKEDGTFRGKRVGEMSREELIDAVREAIAGDKIPCAVCGNPALYLDTNALSRFVCDWIDAKTKRLGEPVAKW